MSLTVERMVNFSHTSLIHTLYLDLEGLFHWIPAAHMDTNCCRNSFNLCCCTVYTEVVFLIQLKQKSPQIYWLLTPPLVLLTNSSMNSTLLQSRLLLETSGTTNPGLGAGDEPEGEPVIGGWDITLAAGDAIIAAKKIGQAKLGGFSS